MTSNINCCYRKFVVWLVERKLVVISWNLQTQLSWNLAKMFSICAKYRCYLLRGHDQSSRSKPPCWKSCRRNSSVFLRTFGNTIEIPDISLTFDKVQDGGLTEPCPVSSYGCFSSLYLCLYFTFCIIYFFTDSKILSGLFSRLYYHPTQFSSALRYVKFCHFHCLVSLDHDS